MSKEKPETKVCKYCKSEIPFEAKICPQCRKKQKSSGCLTVILAVIVLIVLMVSCSGGGTEEQDKKEIVDALVNSPEKTNEADLGDSAEQPEAEAASADEEKAFIEEQVLLEQDGITITAKELVEDSIWGTGIKVQLENSSEKDLGVGCHALIVNNYMITDLFSSTIAAGKTANETIYLSSNQLEASGIENIGEVEIYFYIYDADTYQTVSEADKATIRTSLYEQMDVKAVDDGKELLNQDGIRIVGKYVDEDSFWGKAVLLYIENNSDIHVGISCKDMSINGIMVDPIFTSTVYSGKMSVDDITLFSTDLEENGIEEIEEIELKFHVYNKDSYSTIFDSDVITFSVE